ncbi:MAG: phosphoheptose isomerase, partial [Candidatus Aminicenantes bacterium]
MNIKNSRYSYNLFREEESVKNLISFWEENNFLGRLKNKDWSLWVDAFQPEIIDRLGWLELPERMMDRIKGIETFTQEVKEENFTDLILIGMGGSSLAPEVVQKIFKDAPGFPKLTVCDSTHPQAVEQIRKRLDLKATLFLVSSKSGTTLETMSLFHFFWAEVEKEDAEPG